MPTRESTGAMFPDTHDTNADFKQSTPPPPGALEDILRRWRSPGSQEQDEMLAQIGEDDSDDGGEDMEDTEPERVEDASAGPDCAKRHRYLREADRHMILQRIDQGEKQAELAREFGVTRAAICHIKKNRSQILARSSRPDVHEAARHPKRRMSSAVIEKRRIQQQQHVSTVYEVPSPSLALHLEKLRHRETDTHTFCATADRAFFLLIEEALASSGEASHQPNTTCAMVLGDSGLPMMKAFRSIQPSSPTGFITLACDAQTQELELRKMSAPLGLRGHDVFLLDATCALGNAVCVAIQALLEFGAQESSICFVTLVATATAVAQIYDKYPSVRIVTATVDPEWTSVTGLSPDAFVERYFNTRVVHQSDAGSIVGV